MEQLLKVDTIIVPIGKEQNRILILVSLTAELLFLTIAPSKDYNDELVVDIVLHFVIYSHLTVYGLGIQINWAVSAIYQTFLWSLSTESLHCLATWNLCHSLQPSLFIGTNVLWYFKYFVTGITHTNNNLLPDWLQYRKLPLAL